MDPQVRAELNRIDEILARVDGSGGEAVALEAILKNRLQSTALVGAVVPPGGPITAAVALTQVGTSGKFRVSGNFSAMSAAGAGVVTPHLDIQSGGGPVVVLHAWVQQVVGGPGLTEEIADSCVFEVATAGVPGTVFTVSWQTTAGDLAMTLGAGGSAGAFAAELLVEELP